MSVLVIRRCCSTSPIGRLTPAARLGVCLLGLMVASPVWAGNGGRTRVQRQLRTEHRLRFERFAKDVEALAKWCETTALADEAARTRRLAEPFDMKQLSLVGTKLPTLGTRPSTSRPSGAKGEWDRRSRALRRGYSDDLFRMVRKAVQAGLYSWAQDVCREIIHRDDSHADARRLLGYKPYLNGWVTRFEADMLSGGYLWTKQWGWLPRRVVDRYEAGLRPVRGKWVAKDEAEQYHAKWLNRWTIRTTHYEIQTNASLEAGVALGRVLENLHQVFFRVYLGYYSRKERLRGLLEGAGSRDRLPRLPVHRVSYYRTREDYLRQVRRLGRDKKFEHTVGVYAGGQRRMHFFRGGGFDYATLLHEATHQLFAETKPGANPDRSRGNYWPIEGIACYMETLKFHNGEVHHLWQRNWRLAAARRIVDAGKQVPLDRFVRLGAKGFYGPAGEMLHYCQATGLATFFMHYDDRRYRDRFVEYLQRVYEGRAGRDTLATIMGVPLADLEKQYVEFVSGLELPRRPGPTLRWRPAGAGS